MENNIITLDFNENRKGEVFFGPVDRFCNLAKLYYEAVNMFAEAAKRAVIECREVAGLSGVDFFVEEEQGVPFGFENPNDPNPHIVLNGADGVYRYRIAISFSIEKKEESRSNMMIKYTAYPIVLRTKIKNENGKEEEIESFNPYEGGWIPYTETKDNGIPKEMMDYFSAENPEDYWKIRPLAAYIASGYKIHSKEKFEKILSKNKPIIDLYLRLEDFAEPWFKNENTMCILICPHDGAMVEFENGFFVLNAFAEGKAFRSVFSTKNMQEMASVIGHIFDRAYKSDIIAVVPLSKDAYMTIANNGNVLSYTHRDDDGQLTKKEYKLAEQYLKEYFKRS